MAHDIEINGNKQRNHVCPSDTCGISDICWVFSLVVARVCSRTSIAFR